MAYRLARDTQQLVIPALLEPEQPEHDFIVQDSLAFQFDFKGFLPRHVLPALMVDHYQNIAQYKNQDVVWQNGVLLRPDVGTDAEALVRKLIIMNGRY